MSSSSSTSTSYAQDFSKLVVEEIDAYEAEEEVPKLDFFVRRVNRRLHGEIINTAALCLEKKVVLVENNNKNNNNLVESNNNRNAHSGSSVKKIVSGSSCIDDSNNDLVICPDNLLHHHHSSCYFPDELKRIIFSFLGPAKTPHPFPCPLVTTCYATKQREALLRRSVSFVLEKIQEQMSSNVNDCHQDGQVIVLWSDVPGGGGRHNEQNVLGRLRDMGYVAETVLGPIDGGDGDNNINNIVEVLMGNQFAGNVGNNHNVINDNENVININVNNRDGNQIQDDNQVNNGVNNHQLQNNDNLQNNRNINNNNNRNINNELGPFLSVGLHSSGSQKNRVYRAMVSVRSNVNSFIARSGLNRLRHEHPGIFIYMNWFTKVWLLCFVFFFGLFTSINLYFGRTVI